MANEEASGKAIASLVFGILGVSCVLPLFGPLLAIVLGWGDENGVAKAGVILGWITLGTYALLVLALLALFAIGGLGAFANV